MSGPYGFSTKSEGFFSTDRGAFRCAAAGGLNSAIAHLVLARGTGRDNVTTQWSVNAIEQRTGISRPKAANAVKDLLDRGVWKKTRDGLHPIYEAVPGNQIPGGPFTAEEQAAIAAIRDDKSPPKSDVLTALKTRGIVITKQKNIRGRYGEAFELEADAITALSEPLAAWLPNALIDGAANEVPPVELIRQTRNLPALRLLIELYAVQFLPSYGGVPRDGAQDPEDAIEDAPVVHAWNATRLVREHRSDGCPFVVGKFVTHDSSPRFRGLNHDPKAGLKGPSIRHWR